MHEENDHALAMWKFVQENVKIDTIIKTCFMQAIDIPK